MTHTKQWLHFIGIKGVGMSALAIVAQGLGYKVTGSDVAEEFITDSSLHEAGIQPYEGFDASHITGSIDTIILGTAFGDTNPEVVRAKQLGLRLWTYSELLGHLSSQKQIIAVAGTHGKTTTTSLLSFILYHTHQHPSWIIGTGHVAGLPSHGGAGSGEYFVTEADDYKRANDDPTPKFLDLHPYGIILTNIEHDHPDLYPALEDCIDAFRRFLMLVPSNGFVVTNADDRNIQNLLTEFPQLPVITYGFTEAAEYQIKPYEHGISLSHHGETLGLFPLSIIGQHNAYNAAAAIVTAHHLKVPLEKMQEILPIFKSVERRYEILDEIKGITVIDDYAHHPTAIQLTLEAAKTQNPHQPLYAVFQPHTFSRTEALLKEFGTAFQAADQVIITDIFGSAREATGTIHARDVVTEIQKHHTQVSYVPKDELLLYLQKTMTSPATLLMMGAGDIYKIAKQYVEFMRENHD